MLRMTSELNYQLLISTFNLCLNLINPMTPHKDYPDQDFTKLKYNVALSSESRSSQSHLDSHTNFTSIWLCLNIFHHWIKNLDSSVSKHSELLVSHHSDLRSEGYLYPILWELLLSAECTVVWSYSVKMYSYNLPVCHISIFTLFDYKNNQSIWHTWSILDKSYYPSNKVLFGYEQV